MDMMKITERTVGQIQAVADLLARSDASFIRTQRRYRTGKIWGLAVPVALYVFMLLIGFQQLLLAWQGENYWIMFWAMAGMQPLIAGMAITRIALWTDPRACIRAHQSASTGSAIW